MKNTLRTLLASTSLAVFGLVTFGAAVPAFASDNEPLHVTVPFAFRAGKTLLPAGEYFVYTEASNVIMIKGTRGSAILLSSPSSVAASDKVGISFDRDGDDYCLRSVHAWGKPVSSRIVEPPVALDK